MLEDLSSLGFPSYSGIYVDGRTKDLAEDHERLFLDDYRSYDSKYQNPKHWFSSIRDINTSSLIPCKSWKGTAPLGLETFLRNFDTLEVDLALDFTGQEVVPYCPDGYWWLSNACRNNPADCIPCVTGSSLNYVYDADEVPSECSESQPGALKPSNNTAHCPCLSLQVEGDDQGYYLEHVSGTGHSRRALCRDRLREAGYRTQELSQGLGFGFRV